MDPQQVMTVLGMAPGTAALVAAAVPGVASLLAALLPHPAPGSRWALARALLDWLAINRGNAANALPGRT